MCEVCVKEDQARGPMDSAIKADWVRALRSGEYSQANGALQKNGGFCCLGVLCDLAVKAGVPVRVSTIECGCSDADCCPGVAYDSADSYPPIQVQNWAGMSTMDPVVKDSEGEIRTLSALNDEGRTFEEIAQFIEDQL